MLKKLFIYYTRDIKYKYIYIRVCDEGISNILNICQEGLKNR